MQNYTPLEIAEGKHLPHSAGRYPIDPRYFVGSLAADTVRVNFDKITDLVAVGSVPITEFDIKAIKKAGFDAILDLCGDQSQESQWSQSHGLDYLHEFVHDGYSPRQDQFQRIVEWICGHVGDMRKVYIHCHAGAGRAPTAATAYLIYAQGLSFEDALEVLRARRRVHIVSDRQKLGLRTFERSRNHGKRAS